MSTQATNPAQQHENYTDEEKLVIKKLFTRLIVFLFILFIFSFLDRVNIGFAALTMIDDKDIGLSPTSFGLAASLFYLTYVLCGVPSNVMLSIAGARRWIAIIMVAWGIASTATMFATGPSSLYVIRMIVGICEAGFLPGILLYLTYWFPSFFRARANALFMIAMPITMAFGSILSGYILLLDGYMGLKGWQWLFLLEGFPSIILGFFVWVYLVDSPEKAKWLTARDKEVLHTMMERDKLSIVQPMGSAQYTALQHESTWRGVLTTPVILYTLAYFCLCNSLSAINLWSPRIIQSLAPGSSNAYIGFLASIPQFATILAMIWWSRRSDRKQERRLHTILPFYVGVLGWAVVSLESMPWVQFTGIIVASSAAFTTMALFWTTPDQNISFKSRAVAIAVINAFGNIGSACSPLYIGWLYDLTGTYTYGVSLMALLLVIGASIMLFIPMTRSRPRATP